MSPPAAVAVTAAAVADAAAAAAAGVYRGSPYRWGRHPTVKAARSPAVSLSPFDRRVMLLVMVAMVRVVMLIWIFLLLLLLLFLLLLLLLLLLFIERRISLPIGAMIGGQGRASGISSG